MLAFSPDGRFLAGNDWKHIYLWDARTGKRLRTFDGECVGTISRTVSADGRVLYAMPGVRAAAFSPDGAILATGGENACLYFWDTATGKQIGKTQFDRDVVHSLRFTSDGKRLLSAGYEPRLWDVPSQKVIRTFSTEVTPVAHNVWRAALSADGKTVAAVSQADLYIWNVADANLLHRIPHGGKVPRDLIFSSDGSTVIANPSEGESFLRWNVATGKPMETPPPEEQKSVWRTGCFSADGRLMAWTTTASHLGYAAGWGPLLSVAEVANGKEILRRDVHPPASFVLSADGKTLAMAEGNGAMYLLNTATGKRALTCLEAAYPLIGMSFGDEGRSLRSLTGEGMVHDWDTRGQSERRRLPIPLASEEFPHRLAADGKHVALVDANGGVRVWSVTAGREVWRQKQALAVLEPFLSAKPRDSVDPPPRSRVALEFSPDGRMLLGVAGDGNHLTVWDTASGLTRREIKGESFQAAALSPDARTVFVGAAEKKALVVRGLEVASGKERQRVTLTPPPRRPDGEVRRRVITNLLVSPDGKTVALVEEVTIYLYANRMHYYGLEVAEQRLHVWDTHSRKGPRALTPCGSQAIAFSPDSKRLAYAEAPYCLAVQDLATGATHKTRELGHPDVVRLQFSPDGRALASGSSDGTVLLWDMGKLLAE